MHTKMTCSGCKLYHPEELAEDCRSCVRAFSGRQEDHFKPFSRINIIGQNGGDGLIYKVEGIARILAGEDHDSPLGGANKGKKRWELYVKQAMAVLDYVEEHNA